ncbi:MAG: endonuclease/exonuclease/phosphatase family protein [Gemmataceae bacterium]
MDRSRLPRQNRAYQDWERTLAFFHKIPRPVQALLIVLVVVIGIAWVAGNGKGWNATAANSVSAPSVQPPAGANEPGSYLFCWWNVENLFDDKLDKRGRVDQEFDEGFSDDAELRKLKFDHLTDALLKMNDGKGPDIIACGEVESVRAAEMLMGSLNTRIKAPEQKYKVFAMRNLPNAGRHIMTCVITRLQMAQGATRIHGQQLRILESRLNVNGHELVIFATHWTSQLRQRDGGSGESGRANYARTIRTAVDRIAEKNEQADILICGDFNEVPDSAEVERMLFAIGDKAKVVPAPDPFLFNLMAKKSPEKFGTLWYDGKPLIYDHIVVSPGMLDTNGWSADTESVATVTEGLIRRGATRRQPWRFGDPPADRRKADERGYSDHFPVVVRLNVAAPKMK